MPDDDFTKGTSFSAQHSVYARGALNIAPTDGSTKFNTISIPLIPVACWKLNDPAFAFDSSFVSPAFRSEFVPTPAGSTPDPSTPTDAQLAAPPPADAPLTTLSAIVRANPGCPAALFGHCDPAGSDDLNKTLGDRRVIAIYALLTRQPDLWAYLYDTPQVGDRWDLHMVQTMLANVPDGQGNPYFPGTVNGVQGADTTDAVQRFQNDAGLSASGNPDSQTRKALFGAYMDWLCTPGTSGGTPFRMQPTDFLGGTGAQPGDLPKMSLQSCGKFNPIKLLSAEEMGGVDTSNEPDGASKVQRNADDVPNRRVIMFMFPPGTTVDTGLWPCPEVKQSNAACKNAFWPDGDQRRKNGDTQRLYQDTRDTMACRFYDRFARRSPCEGAKQTCSIVLMDEYESPLAGIPITVTASTPEYTQTSVTDSTGTAKFPGAPRGNLSAKVSDLQKLGVLLAPLIDKRPRNEDYPSGAGWTTTTPKLLAQSVPLQPTAVNRIMVISRTDVLFDVPSGWESLCTSDSGPWHLAFDAARATLALVSQGIGKTVVLQCPAVTKGAEPDLFASLDIDALHAALFAKDDEHVWQTLSQLPREARDDSPGLSDADRQEIAQACQEAKSASATA